MKTELKDEIISFLLNNKRKHNYCEDSWYSCPKAEDGCARDNDGTCDCGADWYNAEVDKLITKIAEDHILTK